jgi:choline dehydrogenase-like flavoprotein
MTTTSPDLVQISAKPAEAPPAELPGERARAVFGERGLTVARALAEAVLPSGTLLPAADERTLDRWAGAVRYFGVPESAFPRLLDLLEVATLPRYRKRFTQLSRQDRADFVFSWHDKDPLRRALFLALVYPLRNAHFDDKGVYQKLGCVWENPAVADATPRWMQQVSSAADLDEEEIECEVVVVGTGAGGAVVAKELAERGVAVLLVEEGEYYQRKDFIRRSMPGMRRLYKNGGLTGVVGNCVIPIPLGKNVGGSTTINTGTCLRAPDWILDRWRSEHGLSDFTPDYLGQFYDKVESTLEVAPATEKANGAPARVVAEGCDALGWSHFPVPRNAPGCDGQGVCQWGCPTEAKRSMNVSYVPMALERGAALVTGLKVERVLVENGRAVGVSGRAVANGRQIRVRARGVVLACGSMATPALLLKNRLANSSGQVGKNLTIHPATGVSALFDRDIRGFEHVPQGHGVDQFHRDGMLMLGAGAPLDMGANMFPYVGDRYMELMQRYDRIASYGVMVEDRPNGRIVLGPGGVPIPLYRLGRHERRLLARGSAAVARIFRAAGAREIFTEIKGHEELATLEDIERLERSCPSPLDIIMIAFHPLGTCRMGADPEKSVVDSYHETHDVPGLYIVDGSVVPTSIAVNTQLTIMALATRAASLIAERFN